jgi:hypothetical protein
VIKIRYADLPEGLHVRIEARGQRAVIYLRPGLSGAQRREALRKVRRTARLAAGPRLSGSGITLAAAMDTAKSTARNGTAAVRYHPAGSLFLTALLASAVVCYMLFVSVSIQLIPAPPAAGGRPAVRVGGSPSPQARPHSAAGPSGQQLSGPAATSSPKGAASPGTSASASASTLRPGPARLAASPVPLRTVSPAPVPSRSPTGAAPSPSASASDPGGLCVHVGPLGVCLSV